MLNDSINIVLTALTSYIVWLLKKQRSDREGTNKAVALLLRRELNELHERFMEKEHISSGQFATFQDIYDTYHDLGGNGTATRWYEDVKKKPIKD